MTAAEVNVVMFNRRRATRAVGQNVVDIGRELNQTGQIHHDEGGDVVLANKPKGHALLLAAGIDKAFKRGVDQDAVNRDAVSVVRGSHG